MWRTVAVIGALLFAPAVSSAQQPCTADANQVVNEIYRHMLERGADAGAAGWVSRLSSGTTVRELVREIAKSPEHMQRFGSQPTQEAVNTMYRHILGRQPDSDGARGFAQMAANRGLGAVVDDILASSEYQQNYGDWGVPGSGGLRYCGSGASNAQVSSTSTATGVPMRFRRMDTNNDGIITRNEWRGNANAFNNRDWNRDGMLSGDEVRVGSTTPASVDNQDFNASISDRFDYLDINGNGFVDKNEWDGTDEAFTRMDRNRDNRLTTNELGNTNSSAFNSVDTNRDGRITLQEWPWSHRAFDQQDSNGDGILQRNEYRGGAVATSGR
jgi:Ca2+-binding EF-hand superfamily protein